VPPTETSAPDRPAATDVAAGPPAVPHRRSVPAPGGGFDRVGGSRLTAAGAVLLAAVIFIVASPPVVADHELVSVVWACLLAVLVIGIVAPLVLVRRLAVGASSPRDAVVGEVVPITVMLSGRVAGLEVRALDPTGPWHRAGAPGTGDLGHIADRRGLFQAVRLEVRVSAPLGVLAAHRVHEVVLPHAVEVAPRPLAVTWLPTPAPLEGGATDRSLPARSGDLVRSVRPYVSGDPSHLVHWPSSARTGELVVRELEPPVPTGQAVVVDLRDLGSQTEQAASYALGACRAVLAAGGRLQLATCEAGGPVVGEVRTVLDAGRRLARAVPGPPASPPEGWPVVEIGS
jgi:uncharacterized protein (DUF58 family)